MMQIQTFLGINENPDGDTGLAPGEASVMKNFRVTADGHLQLRPGTESVLTLVSENPMRGIFSGAVGGENVTVAACGGKLWSLDLNAGTKTEIGTLTDDTTSFFGFAGVLYIQNGHEYMSWDGNPLSPAAEVSGYAPIVAVAAPPAGGGTVLESINKLTGSKRMRFSPDGTTKFFQLCETDIDSVDAVDSLAGQTLSSYTVNLSAGTVTFATAPPSGTSSLEIRWTKGTGDRGKIESMRYAETFNGATDTRVFLYGDGTNTAVYSGIGDSLLPTAEYFPDLNILDIDSSNTPITAMIKHYDRLLSFKPDGCWATAYGALNLADGSVTAAFYTTPLHRETGNIPKGQVRLIENCPLSITGGAIYRWRSGASSIENERNSERISRRIEKTLAAFDLKSVTTLDDSFVGEYYIFCGEKAIVLNYVRGCYYIYEGIRTTASAMIDGTVYIGTADGSILKLTRDKRSDCGEPIEALWESGSMDFGNMHSLKTIADIFIAMKPEAGSRIDVAALTESGAQHPTKVAAQAFLSFLHVDFRHFSLGTSRRPQVGRLKIRAKKFKYLKLRLSSRSASATATVLGIASEPRAVARVR